MRILSTKFQARRPLITFAFEAYTILTPVLFFIWDAFTEGHRVPGLRADYAAILAVGFFVCFLYFLVAAIFQLVTGRFASALISFLFAAAVVTILLFWKPMCASA